jgi:GNAT superfamily N-acetyltransferase
MTAELDPRVRIRPATAADQTVMVDFRLAMFDDIRAYDPTVVPARAPARDPAAQKAANERWMVEHFGRDFEAWIAELDGRPVGSTGLQWFDHAPGPTNPGGREAYLLNVYTRPEARRMGIARALMDRAVARAGETGVRRIWLRASAEGRPLYEAMGFRSGSYMELTAAPVLEPAAEPALEPAAEPEA